MKGTLGWKEVTTIIVNVPRTAAVYTQLCDIEWTSWEGRGSEGKDAEDENMILPTYRTVTRKR